MRKFLVILPFVGLFYFCVFGSAAESLPIDEVIPSVFNVTVDEGDDQFHFGTAFAIHPKGIFVTAAHVVRAHQKGRLEDIQGRVFPFQVLGIDPATDIAFLRTETSETFRPVPIRFGYRPSWNEPVFSIQYLATDNRGRFVNRGFIVGQGSVHGPGYAFSNIIYSDMQADGGGSGAAVFNAKGECIGIVVGGTGGNAGARYTHVVQADHIVAAFLRTMMLRQVRGLGTGISLTRNDDLGLLIEGIDDSSAAQKAGIERGDRILSIDGFPIKNNLDLWLANLVWGLDNHGTPMPIELKKGNDQSVKTVLLLHERDVFQPISIEPENLHPGCLVVCYSEHPESHNAEVLFNGRMQSLDAMPFPASSFVEISGYLRIPREGCYTFRLSLPGKGALIIGERVFADKPNDHARMCGISRGYFEQGLYSYRILLAPAETVDQPVLTYQFFDNGEFSPFRPIPKDWLFYEER